MNLHLLRHSYIQHSELLLHGLNHGTAASSGPRTAKKHLGRSGVVTYADEVNSTVRMTRYLGGETGPVVHIIG